MFQSAAKQAENLAAENTSEELLKLSFKYAYSRHKTFGDGSALVTAVMASYGVLNGFWGLSQSPRDLDDIQAKQKKIFADCMFEKDKPQPQKLQQCVQYSEQKVIPQIKAEGANHLEAAGVSLALAGAFAVARAGYVALSNAYNSRKSEIVSQAQGIKRAEDEAARKQADSVAPIL